MFKKIFNNLEKIASEVVKIFKNKVLMLLIDSV